MLENDTLAWSALLRAVRVEHPDSYRSWFEELSPGHVEGGELRVLVDDPIRTDYLREHCAQVFVHAIMEE